MNKRVILRTMYKRKMSRSFFVYPFLSRHVGDSIMEMRGEESLKLGRGCGLEILAG